MENDHIKLDVAIIGAGIAGLSSAIGFCLAGHSVEIFERSSLLNEVGAAIHVSPNAARILREWKFDFDRARAVRAEMSCIIDAKSLATGYKTRFDGFFEKYGSPWYYLHRVDLHNELRRLAEDPGDGVLGAQLHLAAEVKTVDCESGTLALTDGRTLQKDLIIAADGVHATTIVNGARVCADETSQSAFRFLIPTQKLVDAGLAKVLYIDNEFGLIVAKDSERRLVWYPCRSGELQNFVGIHPTRAGDNNVDQWNIGAPISSLLDEYKSFHPDLVQACGLAEDVKLWKLIYRPPIAAWYKGRVALAGDAAHPMLPHQGQGGAQGIEDAAALGTLFTSIPSPHDIAERLRMYQDVRQRRAAAIQIFSNTGQEQSEEVQEEAKKYVDFIPSNPAEFNEFNFQHDVVRACRDALQRTAS